MAGLGRAGADTPGWNSSRLVQACSGRTESGMGVPLFGLPLLQQGTAAVREAWSQASRPSQPRIATGRYFSLGVKAEEIADNYIEHYYGSD
jgi:alkanesulfonate monooxygenase SsuD/methylene tetrahydromethanopterin reductase-like flavin-dependent oxidoreductase (luciferase family)